MPGLFGRFLSRAVSLVPLNIARVLLHRAIGVRVSLRARIGFGTVIACRKATIGRASIGRFCAFCGPIKLEIADGARISPHNRFACGAWRLDESDAAGRCVIGPRVLITSGHLFDVTGGFSIGEKSCIAGEGSQFWTHGATAQHEPISIGVRCYIGSAVRFAPGAAIGDNCLVGLGSVVTKAFPEANQFIAGAPARVVRTNWDWRTGKAERPFTPEQATTP